jgi:deoxyribonuclease V
MWPISAADLADEQVRLAGLQPPPWSPGAHPTAGGCFVCFGRGGTGPGSAGDPGWAAACVLDGRLRPAGTAVVRGRAGGPYRAGLLALREGRLLADAVAALPAPPDVLLVNATGRDHPRRAGLALQLGAMLGIPTAGVTHRPLLAAGGPPADVRGATAPLVLDGVVVGMWVRTRPGARPLAAHAAWRTTPEIAATVVTATTGRMRTPEPLREARRIARRTRSDAAHRAWYPYPEGYRGDRNATE